jgi:protocatechuate 3,4-dioxygenase beta subunit
MYYGRADPTDQDTASSDAAGAFVLENLTPDLAYTLTAQAPDQPAGKAGPFSVATEATAQVEIRFPAARYVDVLVLYEGEETPVAGAKVLVYQADGQQSASTTTDASGRAHAGPAGDGALTVTVYGPMVALRTQGTPVEGSAEGPGPFTATVHVPRGLTVEGRVLKADGTPAVGAQVELESRGRYQSIDFTTGYPSIDVTTAADGSFVLTSVAPGPQAVRASWRASGAGARLTGRTMTAGGATDATITLGADDGKGLETFKFHVLDEQGAPVASASVRLTHENGSAGSTVADGWATLQTSAAPDSTLGRALAKGAAFVEVSDARGADGLPLPVGPGKVGPLTPDQREIEVRLPAEQTIEGRVVAGEGGRVAGILINARGTAKRSATSSARTDEQGHFRIGGLGDGEYTLTVTAAPEYVPVPAATVPVGTTGHVVRLRRGVTARIQVADPGGRPVSGAGVSTEVTKPAVAAPPSRGGPGAPPAPGEAPGELYTLDGYGGWRGGSGGNVTNQDGVAVLRGLDGELTYTLRVNVPSGRDDVRPYRQERWSPADTDLRMAKGFVVAGAVRDASGKPVAGSRLERKAGESWQHVGLEDGGTFRITGLEPGPVSLRAHGPGRRRDVTPTEATVQAGDEHVVLVVDPGLTLTVRVPNLAERADTRGFGLQASLLAWQDGAWQHADRGHDRQGAGRIVFLGLKPDTRYAVWIPPSGDELYGWAADVRPGEVSVRLQRGGSIRGRVTAPAGVFPGRGVSASNDMGMNVSAQVDASGAYEIKGLPDGQWNVRTWAQSDGKSYQASGQAQTGGALDLALEPQDAAPAPAPPPAPVGVPR